ncbi:MAG: GlcNAc-PI de-N-acetylase [Cyclobacteriaceae bacterium]|nr:MAG: GlcNAc-PI de-N-acetylase [Cyclobacteriaceae bacterium]
MHRNLFRISFLVLIALSNSTLWAQLQKHSASDIQLDLKKLSSLGSVLYVAAHPDDENTRLIAYLANEALLNTAYLSVTRGDGGQNLIGPEIQEMLGVIRTQELLQARRIDGGQQFFTRANDFGYSKNPEETLSIWDKEKILADVVWVIRKFKPDVIITRFPSDGRGRHGHHTASAILAEEAFDAAADPDRYPEQLQYVAPWQTRSLMFNTTWWFSGSPENFNSDGMIPIDVGRYNPLLGQSYTEMAAESRSMHKSQGFGSTGTRGTEMEYLEHVKGERLPLDYFDNPVKNWQSIGGGEALARILARANQIFDPEHPSDITPVLLEALDQLESLEDPYWKSVKEKQLTELIKSVLGLYLEASTNTSSATPGESIKVRLEATNRSEVPVIINQVGIPGVEPEVRGMELGSNQKFEQEVTLEIPQDQAYSQPYWLKSAGNLGMYEVDNQQLIGQPENKPAITVPIELTISGTPLSYEVPLVYKRNDPVKGEVVQPFPITPPVAINFQEKVQTFADQGPRSLSILVKSGRSQVYGNLKLVVPDGWKALPEQVSFELSQKGEEQQVEFIVYPPSSPGEGIISAVAEVGGKSYRMESVTIQYDHIPNQLLLPEASVKVVKLDITTGGQRIGYVMGAGDDIPNSLRQIGYTVDILEPDDLTVINLKGYHAVILGIRALNTVQRLKFKMPELLSYVEEGGTLIVQYNTSHRLVTNDFAPYPINLSRDRVSVEDAPVTLLDPNHRLLNHPNKITAADFDGWVQERGLYFPDQWDQRYQPILSINDPGESPKQGGLLVTKYGEGHYIYTGLSWFRELPAGVPGAYRLFANLVSLGQQEPEN